VGGGGGGAGVLSGLSYMQRGDIAHAKEDHT
jgi:hypothetical protein